MNSVAKQPPRNRVRDIIFGVILVLLILAIPEGLSFAFGMTLGKRLFSDQTNYFRSIDAAKFQKWQESPWHDNELGWRVPITPVSQSEENCLGKTINYNVHDGQRATTGSGMPTVALFGGSFVYGQEADDDSTIASTLWRNHEISALNYGAPGYSPEQAVLKFERLLKERALPANAILIITHENIRWTANSFRPAYLSSTDIVFGLKPYMQSGELIPLASPSDYRGFVDEASKRFASDFWARPELSFPYTVSLIEAVSTRSYYFRNWASFGQAPYTYEFTTDNPLRRNMTVLAKRFRDDALAANIKPLIILMSANHASYQVSASYSKSLDQELGGGVVLEFTDSDIDWSRYNLKADGDCHLSQYGAARVAKFISQAITK